MLYIGLALVVGLAGFLAAALVYNKKNRAKTQADAVEPWQQRAQGVFLALMEGRCDYAFEPDDAVREMLAAGWNVSTEDQLWAELGELEQAEAPAWDLTRAMLLTRAAVAVGFLDNTRSWERIRGQLDALQKHYATWEEYEHSLLASRRTWRNLPEGQDDESMEDVRREIGDVKKHIWQNISFRDAS